MNLRKNSLLIPLGALALSMASVGSCSQLEVSKEPGTEGLQQTADEPRRAIRRDMPMTNAIRRAFAAGTRDETGRPGPNAVRRRRDLSRQRSSVPGGREKHGGMSGRRGGVRHRRDL